MLDLYTVHLQCLKISTAMQELLACILINLQRLLSTLTAQGFGPLQEAYLQAWLHTNQKVIGAQSGIPQSKHADNI